MVEMGGCDESESPQEWTLSHHQAAWANDAAPTTACPCGPQAAMVRLGPPLFKVLLGGCIRQGWPSATSPGQGCKTATICGCLVCSGGPAASGDLRHLQVRVQCPSLWQRRQREAFGQSTATWS
jgi:hypothetical protein